MARQENTALPAALAAAQEQLHRRRLQRRQERLAQRLPVRTDDHGRLASAPEQPNARSQAPGAPDPTLESQPWGQTIFAGRKQQQVRATREAALSLSWLPQAHRVNPPKTQTEKAAPLSITQSFTLYPDLAIAMLRNDVAAPGRVWLLLRHLDHRGCGWISIAQARAMLTGKQSPIRICGWRQMRNLLSQGDGIFWQRNGDTGKDGRIWLRSPAKVALKLGLRRFNRRPVRIPLQILVDGMGTVRAHFFASFHSGRDTKNPIARQTLEELTGVGRRSQQAYETKAGVEKRYNWAIGDAYSKAEAERRAWQHGNALFELHDHQGKSGAAGQSYVAWQMPNSYVGPHAAEAPARKKRINRQLADLFNKGKTGNGEKKVERTPLDGGCPVTRYFEHGSAAARAYNRHAQNDLYWRATQSYRHYKVWHLLPAQTR